MRHRNGSKRFLWAMVVLGLMWGAPGFAGSQTAVYDLERCIERAIEANRELRIRRKAEEKAGDRVREAWSGAFPQLSLDGTFSRNFKLPSFFFGDFGDSAAEDTRIEFGSDYDYQASLGLRQPIWLGGKVGVAVTAAKLFDLSAISQSEALVQDVVFRTKVLFYAALLAREEIAVFQSSLDQAKRHLESARLRRDRGIDSDFEVLRAEVEVANQEPPLIAAENLYRQALNRLKVVLGLPVEDPIEVRGKLDYTPVPGERLEGRSESALRERPDRQAKELGLRLVRQQLRAVKADRYPSFYLLAAYLFQGSSDDLSFDDRERSTASSASIEVSFPFWTSGATSARVRQARADVEMARLALELVDEEIARDVRATELNLESSDKRVEANRRTVELAERAFEIAETRYENGLLSQIELLDARDALTAARVNLLRSLHDALVAQSTWERAVGVEWGEAW